jgi:hypothetical protein
MPLVDASNVSFLSRWDIDKIVDHNTTSVIVPATSNATAIINHTYGYRPYIIAQYKPPLGSVWYEAGENLKFSAFQLVSMNAWITASTITFRVDNGHGTPQTVAIRYWVLSDGN